MIKPPDFKCLCRDCKYLEYFMLDATYSCAIHNIFVEPLGYCDKGEPK